VCAIFRSFMHICGSGFLRFRVHHGSGAQPASYLNGPAGPFAGVKRPKCVANHPLSCIPEVKNRGSFTSDHPCVAWFST